MTGVTLDLDANIIQVERDKLADGEFRTLRGFFIETDAIAPSGGRLWKASLDLQPGDRLHRDKLFAVFTNEHHWALIGLFGIADIVQHNMLLIALRYIASEYTLFSRFERLYGPLGRHKTRVENIEKRMTRLFRDLAKEPLLWRLLCPSINNRSTQEEVDGYRTDGEKLLQQLSIVRNSAAMLASDERKRRAWRNESWYSAETGMSAERRFIWERVFKLWRALGRRVGYSENGPIIRALHGIHQALEIEAPRALSVRKAINEFNRQAPPATEQNP